MADADESQCSILIAGVGNIFLGDDAFGSEVARSLDTTLMPPGVRVVDYGIGGIHLAYDLLDGVDLLVMIDAVEHGRDPGTVSVIEVDPADVGPAALDSHAMDPAAVLAHVDRLGGTVPRTLIIACQPADCAEGLGLSDVVLAAVTTAVAAVH
ncbi:hydrogenase maturation protease [soil metagenome]